MWHALVRAIVFYKAWKICFFLLSIQDFHDRLVALRVLAGSWAKLELSLSALEMLDLSCVTISTHGYL
jgi:hypothetical protein